MRLEMKSALSYYSIAEEADPQQRKSDSIETSSRDGVPLPRRKLNERVYLARAEQQSAQSE